MTTEQMLTEAMKTTGGLTNCGGINESVISQWASTMLATLNLIVTIERFCRIISQICGQYVELLDCRKVFERQDVGKIALKSNKSH